MRNRAELSIITGIPEDEILNVYAYGSEVYGTWKQGSDEDFIIVRSGEHDTADVRNGDIDVTIYDIAHFQQKVDDHYIANLECIWLPDALKYELHTFRFDCVLPKLRHSISECCSISHIKCRKRLIPTNNYYDPYSAKKSFWHAIRMANFGIQIATLGKIEDYGVVNCFRQPILDMPDDWAKIQEKWQPVLNQYLTAFRSVAPKE